MRARFQNLRFQLEEWGVFPKSRLSHSAWYLLGMDIFLFLLQLILRLAGGSASDTLRPWVILLSFAVIILFVLVGIRWVRQRLMWRLRNRLIITYIFIGVIPAILLVTIAFLTLYLFAGQFVNFVVISELNARLRSLKDSNTTVAAEMARQIEAKQSTADFIKNLKLRDPDWKNRSICVWENNTMLLCDENISQFPRAAVSLAAHPTGIFVRDRNLLGLRTATVVDIQSGKLTVVANEPFDQNLLADIAKDLGEVTLFHSPAQASTDAGSAISTTPGENVSDLNAISAGTLPGPANFMDWKIDFGMPLPLMDWTPGGAIPASQKLNAFSHTRPSILYSHLFAALGGYVQAVEYGLFTIGIIFAIIELVALYIGTRLTQSVTGAVAQLYAATTFVNRGDLSHRVPIQSSDQLASLATSFNAMTASLENLLEEQRDKQKLENELIIAQEVQAQLFPSKITQLGSLEVHGFCRPAKTVSGDYYDFLTVDPETLIFAVGDVSGKGISAALLMATIHSAVRAYSIEGIPLVRQMMAAGGNELSSLPSQELRGAEVSPSSLLSLLNHQLYASTPMEKYATLFLAFYDGRKRKLTYTNGGHLPPIILTENGAVRRLDCGGTVVGLFDNVSYDEASTILHPGEIFLAYSDGVTEPENDYGEFGEDRLMELVYENRHLPLAEISEIITAALDDWIGAREQPDDVTLVLARAR